MSDKRPTQFICVVGQLIENFTHLDLVGPSEIRVEFSIRLYFFFNKNP